jgi:hypothetical protein
MVLSSPVSSNFEYDHAVTAVVAMFWMAHVGVDQPITAQLARPDGHDALGVRQPLDEVKRVDLQAGLEQQLQVVEQQSRCPSFTPTFTGKDWSRSPNERSNLVLPPLPASRINLL